MQLHRNATRLQGPPAGAAYPVWFHRRQIAASAAFVVAAAVLAAAMPLLLALALLEHHRTGRRRRRLLGLIVLAIIGHAVLWVWREVWRHPLEPRGPWHPCRQCGFPITNTSRAQFCSSGCRRYARLEIRASAGDERAQIRLAWLTREDKHDPVWGEVPF
jgi:hypothetical protein